MIQYYSPHLTFSSVIRAFLSRNSKERIIDYFRKYTGKEYILITSSARSALYLSYASIDLKGNVITSPLTCTSALDPIIQSGNSIIFCDISKDSLNMEPEQIIGKIDDSVFAIQIIHFGGVPIDVKSIRNNLPVRKIFIVEDCAQGFGSKINKENTGQHGDIACFSLIKNFYGIGGGILATNDYHIYKKARELQENFPITSSILVYFRIIRNILETFRSSILGDFFYHFLMKHRRLKKESSKNFSDSLFKPSKLFIKIAAKQISKLDRLHSQRISVATKLLSKLHENNLISNYNETDISGSSFTKFTVFSDRFLIPDHIKLLNDIGIEAKHLEHKYGCYYQARLDQQEQYRANKTLSLCNNYFSIHDSIINLPLHEKMTDKEIDTIVLQLIKLTAT